MTALRPVPSLVTAPVDDGYLAYDVGTGRMHHLNAAAALVFELCDGSRGFTDIEGALRPVVGDAWSVCHDWLVTAVRDGLVVERTDTAIDARIATSEALATLAAALRDKDAVLAAFVCQSRAAELAPEDTLLWYQLGELAHIVGRRQVATAAYERYRRAHPDDAEVEHLLVSLRDERPPARVSDRCIRQLYARFASYYDENMRGDLDYRAPEFLGEAIGRALGNRHDLRIVDLGCGTGLSGRQLRPRAAWLAGVDLSSDMVTRARAQGVYDSLRVDEITAYLTDEATGTFDLVAACDTFIYFGDLRQVVAPAARRLAPGGVLAFTVERGDTYPLQLTGSGRFAHHVRHLSEVAADAGLSVLEITEHVLRYEYGVPVTGLTAVFAAPTASSVKRRWFRLPCGRVVKRHPHDAMNNRTAATRIAAIDVMRGLVIIPMMLDHVRERFYMHVGTGDPIAEAIGPDLSFTRIATHCVRPSSSFWPGCRRGSTLTRRVARTVRRRTSC